MEVEYFRSWSCWFKPNATEKAKNKKQNISVPNNILSGQHTYIHVYIHSSQHNNQLWKNVLEEIRNSTSLPMF